MEYQEFLCAVTEELNRKFNHGTKASIYEAVKNNSMKRKGVLIESADSNVNPTIYMEHFYEQYLKGLSVNQAVTDIMGFYHSVKFKGSFDTSQFKEFEAIKDKIVFKLINFDKNAELLKELPHIKVLDLAIVFYVLLKAGDHGIAAIAVRSGQMKTWKTNVKELYKLASDNVKTLLPARFYPMSEALRGFISLEGGVLAEEDEMMYVLTNTYQNCGAACMVYPNALEMIGNMLGEDFYILPSSIHELIVVPASKGIPPELFDDMVDEINKTQVEPEEVLANHCYYYRREPKELLPGREVRQTDEMMRLKK